MSVDRTNLGKDTDAEADDDTPSVNQPSSPPPDRPGVDGYPSRVASRRGAQAGDHASDKKFIENLDETKAGHSSTAEARERSNHESLEQWAARRATELQEQLPEKDAWACDNGGGNS